MPSGIYKHKPHSKTTKEKMSRAAKGKILSKATKRKISETKQGRTTPQETKLKISEALKGQKNRLGTKQTLEVRKKIGKANSRENFWNWKGGRKNHNGYILILKPKHPSAVYKYIFEHRIIAEKYLGRYLTKREVVHHINGVKDDNRVDNLYLFANNIEHLKFERLKNKPTLKNNFNIYETNQSKC